MDISQPCELTTEPLAVTAGAVRLKESPGHKAGRVDIGTIVGLSVTAKATKEKKKLRDKFLDLFRKKPAEKNEDAKPVEEEDGNRNSTRRESGSNLAQMVTVKFTIPNSWMMGIKGAKATLTNRSSEVVAKALVEVVYYNEDNDVVDKRTISFTDIKSKQTKAVAVADHSTATRLEYNVISAVGNEPFAKL